MKQPAYAVAMVVAVAALLAGAQGYQPRTAVPRLQLAACSTVPTTTTPEHGGRFRLPSTSGAARGGSGGQDCDVQAALSAPSDSTPWCVSRTSPFDPNAVVLHSGPWAANLSAWKIIPGGGGVYRFSLEVPGQGPQPYCLVADAASSAVQLAVSAVPAACANSLDGAFLWDAANRTLRDSRDPSRCIVWVSSPSPSPPPPPPPPAPPGPGMFVVDMSAAGRRQVVEGVEVELQSDSIGSHNDGLPNATTGVPHDLTPSERARFATEVMRGVRYIRLAMGLFLRGLDDERKHIVGRWPTQMAELRELQEMSGLDGWAPEYWSPPPYWKSSGQYIGGTLASFNESFLTEFGKACVQDLQYLRDAGLHVKWWGLQNEPNFAHENVTCPPQSSGKGRGSMRSPDPPSTEDARGPALRDSYSTCKFTQCSYYEAFKVVAPMIRAWDPSVRIHANSATGQLGASPIGNDASVRRFVDAWTWHNVDGPSLRTFNGTQGRNRSGIPAFTNEMEYQPGSRFSGTADGTVNFVNMFLNNLKFTDAPTGVLCLHAIKPITNVESLGYGWTWWRPTNYTNTSIFPTLPANHFEFNYWNWAAVAPFVKDLPWNSIRRDVHEDYTRPMQRIVAFETPAGGLGGPLHRLRAAGKLIVVVTNQDASTPFTANITANDGLSRRFQGFQYIGAADASTFNTSLGIASLTGSGARGGGVGSSSPGGVGGGFQTTLPPLSVQWWFEL